MTGREKIGQELGNKKLMSYNLINLTFSWLICTEIIRENVEGLILLIYFDVRRSWL